MNAELERAPSQEAAVAKEKYIIELPQWSGPYDILLQVIDEQDLNLLDLDISVLLEHYLLYLESTPEIDLEEAGEFLVVAATLAQIKSKLLLPKEEQALEEEENDPREDLVKYLIEYQKIRQAAAALGERPLLGRDVFVKGTHEAFEGMELDGSGKLFQLVKGFQNVMRELNAQTPLQITREEVSVAERRMEIFHEVNGRQEVELEELFRQQPRRTFLIVTFLALLELIRLKKVKLVERTQDQKLFLRFVEGATDADIVHSEFDTTVEDATDSVEGNT